MTAGRLVTKHPATTLAPERDATAATERSVRTLDGVACLVLAQLRPRHWHWGWRRVAFERWWPPRVAGLRFLKTLGSGIDGGFGLMPSASHQGLFCVFDDLASAEAFLAHAPLMQRYRERSAELFTAVLRPASARGTWDGMSLAAGAPLAPDAPVATLTRAAIRPQAARAFWRHAPAAQAGLAQAEGCQLAVGLGEAPLLRQATFSLWDSAAAMDAYARAGAHQEAIRAAWRHQFFSESMFVRFAPLALAGRWKGRDFG